MRVQTISAQEAREAEAERGPLANGEYDFEIVGAEEQISKTSNLGMFVLQLKVFTPDGRFRTVRDYVMAEGKMAWRLRQCCEGVGLLARYERGEIDARDFEGAVGRCFLTTRKDPNGQFPPQNQVRDYLPGPAGAARSAQGNTAAVRRQGTVMAGGDIDDDVPF